MRMRWHHLLFAHWPIDSELLGKLIPAPLQLDTFDSKAWIGVVPFLMSDTAPRCIPPIPGISAFPELNVRTYVTIDDKPGVWFFSLDAASRLAVRVARRSFHLPYMDARMTIERNEVSGADDPSDASDHIACFEYHSHRTHRGEASAVFKGRYGPDGTVFHAEPGTLEHWLTARYCLYSQRASDGKIFRGEIDHPPWPLQKAWGDFDQNTMCESIGIELNGNPHLLFVDDIRVRAWLLEKVTI